MNTCRIFVLSECNFKHVDRVLCQKAEEQGAYLAVSREGIHVHVDGDVQKMLTYIT